MNQTKAPIRFSDYLTRLPVHVQHCELCNQDRKCATTLIYIASPESHMIGHMTAPPCRVGLDLINGAVRDNKKVGVLEPAVSKIKSLKFATEAAIAILRIDDIIKLTPEKSE